MVDDRLIRVFIEFGRLSLVRLTDKVTRVYFNKKVLTRTVIASVDLRIRDGKHYHSQTTFCSVVALG